MNNYLKEKTFKLKMTPYPYLNAMIYDVLVLPPIEAFFHKKVEELTIEDYDYIINNPIIVYLVTKTPCNKTCTITCNRTSDNTYTLTLKTTFPIYFETNDHSTTMIFGNPFLDLKTNKNN